MKGKHSVSFPYGNGTLSVAIDVVEATSGRAMVQECLLNGYAKSGYDDAAWPGGEWMKYTIQEPLVDVELGISQ